MKPLPIFLVHWGDADYLKYSIRQAKIFNPESPVYLLGDRSNNHYKETSHSMIEEYSKSAMAFEKIYTHLCFLSEYYVLYWFKRWFILKDFFAVHPSDSPFLYIDSDVLLYCNVTEEYENFKQYDFTTCGERGPQFTFFKSPAALNSFCEFVEKLYTDTHYFERLKKKWDYHLATNAPGGVDDMFAFYEYKKDFPDNVGDTSVVIGQGAFESDLNTAEGFVYDHNKGIKKIFFENNLPHGNQQDTQQRVRFKGLHFQGAAKRYMHRFYSGKDLFCSKMYSEYLYRIHYPSISRLVTLKKKMST